MLAERVFVAWHKARNEPTLFDGAEEMLRRLKRTMKIGCSAPTFSFADLHAQQSIGKQSKPAFGECE